MKVSKIFGCVIGLHLGVIAMLLVQPGCRTKQPPTRTYSQERTSGGLIEAIGQGSGSGLDSAFNAGFDDGSAAPDDNDFSEFDAITPVAPLSDGGQTVPVAGPSFETYTVKKGDNLWTIARRSNVSLNELYAANGLDTTSILSIGQQLQIPVEGSTATVTAPSPDTYQPTSFNQGSTEYMVKRGDSLSKIANQFDTSVRAIKAANGLSSDLIRVGDKLVVPVSITSTGTSSAMTAAPSDSISSSSTAPSFSASGARTHTVKSGEYPGKIASQYDMTTDELLALNGITDPRKLQVGKILKVSGSTTANVDPPAQLVSTTTEASSTLMTKPAPEASPSPTTSTGPIEIKVIESDPLVEGEATEIEPDEMFEGAVEIPVIRLDAE